MALGGAGAPGGHFDKGGVLTSQTSTQNTQTQQAARQQDQRGRFGSSIPGNRTAERHVIEHDLIRGTTKIDGLGGAGEGNASGDERAEGGSVPRTVAGSGQQRQACEQRTGAVQAAPDIDRTAYIDGGVEIGRAS